MYPYHTPSIRHEQQTAYRDVPRNGHNRATAFNRKRRHHDDTRGDLLHDLDRNANLRKSERLIEMSKVTESQKRARDKWDDENKERKKYISHRARARSFIRDHATAEDLDELEALIQERREMLNGN